MSSSSSSEGNYMTDSDNVSDIFEDGDTLPVDNVDTVSEEESWAGIYFSVGILYMVFIK